MVTLPAVKPSIYSSLLLTVWFGLVMYSVPVVIGKSGAGINVLSVRIVELIRFELPTEARSCSRTELPHLRRCGITWLLQLRMIRRQRYAALGGKRERQVRLALGRWKGLGRAVLVLYGVFATILPLAALVIVALQGYWSSVIRVDEFSLNTFRIVLIDDPLTVSSFKNSLMLGAVGATIAVLAASIISLSSWKTRSRTLKIAEGAIRLPATLSSIILAPGSCSCSAARHSDWPAR